MIPDAYYSLRPFIPRRMQLMLRRWRVRHQRQQNGYCWPLWEAAGAAPPNWPGWPAGKRFALVLTHDVESNLGVSRCEQLADIEEERGFRSTFGFVPFRYETPDRLRRTLVDRGCEITVHDYNHDGKLFRNRRIFEERRGPVNEVLERWKTRGFASAATLHNLAWIGELDIDYDTSTFDVDPFEPQSCGVGRIFPFWVQPPNGDGRGFVELPYTLPQDFTLFILMRELSNDIWRTKLDWIAEKGGMALIKTHPDYMAFGKEDGRNDHYPVEFYAGLLDYVRERYGNEVWLASPAEMARYWMGLRPTDAGGAIADHGTLCAGCQKAHSAGWLSHYRPPSLSSE